MPRPEEAAAHRGGAGAEQRSITRVAARQVWHSIVHKLQAGRPASASESGMWLGAAPSCHGYPASVSSPLSVFLSITIAAVTPLFSVVPVPSTRASAQLRRIAEDGSAGRSPDTLESRNRDPKSSVAALRKP